MLTVQSLKEIAKCDKHRLSITLRCLAFVNTFEDLKVLFLAKFTDRQTDGDRMLSIKVQRLFSIFETVQ
jgi:hypothetical protein